MDNPVICPETGLSLIQRPEWIDVRCSDTFRITAKILDKSILVMIVKGFATLEGQKKSFELKNRIITEFFPGNHDYVIILDWTMVKGSSHRARQLFLANLVKQQPLAIVFCLATRKQGYVPRISRAIKLLPYDLEICRNYQEAVQTAVLKLLSNVSRPKSEKSKLELDLIHKASTNDHGGLQKGVGQFLHRIFRSFISLFSKSVRYERYVDDLIAYLASLNFKTDGFADPLGINQNHPFIPVFDTITIIRSSLFKAFQERDDVEKALRESQRQLQDMAANIPGVIYQFYAKPGNEYGLSYISPRSLDVLGIPHECEGFFGKVAERIVPEDLEMFLESVDKAVKEVSIWQCEGRFQKPSGEIISLRAIARPTKYEDRVVYNGVFLDITEEIKVKNSLMEKEKNFRDLAETTPIPIFLYRDNRIFYVNKAASEVFGYSKEDFVSRYFWEFTHPDYRDKVKQVGKARQEGVKEISEYESKFITKAGAEKWVNISGASIIFGGKRTGLAAIADITKQKEIEEELKMHRLNLEKLVEERTGELRKSEEKFRRLIANLPDNYIFYTITPDRMIEFIAFHKNSLGLSTKHTKKHISDFITDNPKNQKIHEYLQKAFEGIPQPMYEVEVYHQNGSKRVLEINESPVSGNDGVVLLVEGIAHDITIQKHAEEEIHELNQFQKSIIDNANIWLFVTDNDLNILIWNKTAERISGYTKEDVIGNNKIWKWLYPDREYRHFIAKQTVDTIPLGAVIEDLETEIKTKSGETRTLSWNSRSLLDKNNKPIGAIALGHDITDRKLTEEALKEAKEKAELANRAKSVFLANMSHEIRTPMNAILGFTEILKGLITQPQNREYLSSIESSGKSLLVLINDILDLARVEAGKLDLEYKAFDPRPIFKEMEQVFSDKIKDKKLDFRLNTGPNLPKAIVLDESRLRQILLNLVGNAIKFTNSGYIDLSLDYCEPDDVSSVPKFIFSVEDTGIGIPQDQRETIFGAFEQQKGQSSLAFGGTGLGLAITKRLVTMMNGTIDVSGEVGKGSKFTVEIKDVKTASVSSDLLEKNDIDFNSIVFKNARILIVDDIESNRNLLLSFLAKYDFDIVEALNGQEAIASIKKQPPDLILMEMRMPVMSGYETAEYLKVNKDFCHIPIIAVTASVMKEEISKIEKICDAHIAKPVQKRELITKLAYFLTHSITEANTSNEQETITVPFAETPDSEIQSRLPELHKILDEKYKKAWEKLHNTASINEIEEFAEQVKKLAEEYQFKPLYEWGEKLLGQTVTFKIEAIPQTLKEFPGQLEMVKSAITS